MSLEKDIYALTAAINTLTQAIGEASRTVGAVPELGAPYDMDGDPEKLEAAAAPTVDQHAAARAEMRRQKAAPTVPLEAYEVAAGMGIPAEQVVADYKTPAQVDAANYEKDNPVKEEAPKPRRKRRSKAEMEAAKAEKPSAGERILESGAQALKIAEAPTPEPTPAPTPAPEKTLSYDDDLRPRIQAYANSIGVENRRDALIALFGKVDCTNGRAVAADEKLWPGMDEALEEVGY